jgi:uncharacterized membrane protein YfcA
LLPFHVLSLFGFFGKQSKEVKKVNKMAALLISTGIGFLSGLIGIG